ncbi:MAG: hypothetical protein PVJ92_01445 [Candidatus Dependentiae bacterium]|jgi:hypothetical protein
MKKFLYTFAFLVLFAGSSTTHLQARPNNGTVLAMAALAGLTTDGAIRGKNSWGYRKAAGLKENMQALFAWAKDGRPVTEKLKDLKAHFGRNWGKYALLLLFVVLPLIRKYRVDKLWLKRKYDWKKDPSSWLVPEGLSTKYSTRNEAEKAGKDQQSKPVPTGYRLQRLGFKGTPTTYGIRYVPMGTPRQFWLGNKKPGSTFIYGDVDLKSGNRFDRAIVPLGRPWALAEKALLAGGTKAKQD